MSGKKSCELCSTDFVFLNKYREDAPRRLPWSALLRGALARVGALVPTVARFLCAAVAWLLLVPFVTYWLHCFAFCRGLRDVWGLMKRYDLTVGNVAMDCFRGACVCCCIVFFLGSLSLCQELVEAALRRVAGAVDGGRGGAGGGPAGRGDPAPPPRAVLLNRMPEDAGADAGADAGVGWEPAGGGRGGAGNADGRAPAIAPIQAGAGDAGPVLALNEDEVGATSGGYREGNRVAGAGVGAARGGCCALYTSLWPALHTTGWWC